MNPYEVVYLDIETAPQADLPDPPDGFLMKGVGSNWKDEAKIEAQREKNRTAWAERAALDWRLGQIIAVGLIDTGNNLKISMNYEDNEAGLLVWLWNHPDFTTRVTPRLVGFNIRAFDLPFLMGRSAIHGITPSRRFNLAKFRWPERSDIPIDWCDLLSFWGQFDLAGWGLADYARAFKLPNQPYGEGAKVPAAWRDGDYVYVDRHLHSDLAMIQQLHEKLRKGYGL